jgi:Gpi18-like mannosyltransferase
MNIFTNSLAKYLKVKRFILKHDFYLAIVIAAAVIFLGVIFGWYNNKVVLPNPSITAHYVQEQTNPLSFMSNWDGPDYINIEQNGYSSTAETNFFPLYPLLTRIVNSVISSPLISALAVAWFSFVGAIYFYLKLVKLLFKINDNQEAILGLLPFIFFPTAIFFLATYTESLFAFLALGAIYWALKRQYKWSALMLLLLGLTNVTFALVLALVAMIMIEQRAKIRHLIGAMLVGVLGFLGYIYFLWAQFAKPLAFLTSQVKGHGWLEHGFGYIIASADPFNVIFIILLIISAIYWWKKRQSFAIYSLLFILIPLVGRQFGGFNRYVLMAFPLELMIYAYFKDKKVGYSLAMIVLVVSWTYFLLQYAGGYVGG